MGICVAVWRLPNKNHTHALLARQPEAFSPGQSLELLPAGFLFCPFERTQSGYFLNADYLFTFVNHELQAPDSPQQADAQTWLKSLPDSPPVASFHLGTDHGTRKIPDFKALTRTCVEYIERGHFEKIVPSRCKFIQLAPGFDPLLAFEKLSAAYPLAFVSLVSLPGIGTWIGASPETLVEVQNQRTFRTVALAGTQPYRLGVDLKHVSWTQKEIEEQALVSRYIINCFKKIRLREFDEHGPKTVVAGNLMHLKTDFEVDLQATNFPQLGTVMLDLLHPTSAVCGMPIEPAWKFLRQHEGYSREFYSGFLGPVQVDQAIHLFVNLRCMKVLPNQVVFYAGSGVTADSVPEHEWEETELKMNTLLSVIR
jgi:isochorismate synthase